MDETALKKLIHKYKMGSVVVLALTLVVMLLVDYWLNTSMANQRFQLGLAQQYNTPALLWGALITGLNLVLWLLFNAMEKILLHINKTPA
jgi:hypothetical protein